MNINVEAMPEHLKDLIAEATLKEVKAFITTPGGMEFLDQKRKEQKHEKDDDQKRTYCLRGDG